MIKFNSKLKILLDVYFERYNQPDFITDDPIQVPHSFSKKEDIEIAAFFTCIMAWGKRKQIINNAYKLMAIMNNSPFDYIMSFNNEMLQQLSNFKHRTINGNDIVNLVLALKHIYKNQGGLESFFTQEFKKNNNLFDSLTLLYDFVLNYTQDRHTTKHISNVKNNSAAKKLNLFLRWMVRKDANGVDFGLWQNIPISSLYIPLDVHVSEMARHLGLLTRMQNDWKAVVELTQNLRQFDQNDPIKYDYALFGMGLERFKI
ncbi:MAG: TIGR02757 family protein [Bacteroidales bacterium]|nr:TIGR02757 family protein [Bacteroidales bacterium]